MKKIQSLLAEIGQLRSGLHTKDFLLTWEQTPAELRQVLMLADAIKRMRAENIDTRVFGTGIGVSVFRDNSTRTRFSYASALNLLGLTQQDLDEGKSQIAHGETVRETANMIAFFTQSRAGFPSARHVINNVVVEGDGDTAKSSAYLQVLRTDDGAIGVVSVARYLDTLKRTAAGWRRAHRTVVIG